MEIKMRSGQKACSLLRPASGMWRRASQARNHYLYLQPKKKSHKGEREKAELDYNECRRVGAQISLYTHTLERNEELRDVLFADEGWKMA